MRNYYLSITIIFFSALNYCVANTIHSLINFLNGDFKQKVIKTKALGHKLATINQSNVLKVLDLENNGLLLLKIRSNINIVFFISFEDENNILIGVYNQDEKKFQVYKADIITNKKYLIFEKEKITCLKSNISLFNQFFYIIDQEYNCYFFDLNKKEMIKEYKHDKNDIYDISFSNDNQMAVIMKSNIAYTLNMFNMNILDSIHPINFKEEKMYVTPDKEKIIKTSRDGWIDIIGIKEKKFLFSRKHNNLIDKLSFIDFGSKIVYNTINGVYEADSVFIADVNTLNILQSYKRFNVCLDEPLRINDEYYSISSDSIIPDSLFLFNLESPDFQYKISSRYNFHSFIDSGKYFITQNSINNYSLYLTDGCKYIKNFNFYQTLFFHPDNNIAYYQNSDTVVFFDIISNNMIKTIILDDNLKITSSMINKGVIFAENGDYGIFLDYHKGNIIRRIDSIHLSPIENKNLHNRFNENLHYALLYKKGSSDSSNTIKIFDLFDDKIIYIKKDKASSNYKFAFYQNDKIFIKFDNEPLKLFSLETGGELRSYESNLLPDKVEQMIISPDERYIYFSNYDQIVYLNLHTQKFFIFEYTFEGIIGHIEVSLNNKYFLINDDFNSILLYRIINQSHAHFLKFDNNIKIYPNPAGEYIEIKKPSEVFKPSEGYIRIYDVLGECVNLTPALSTGEGVRIDVSGFPPGIYIVRLGNWTGKFVKVE